MRVLLMVWLLLGSSAAWSTDFQQLLQLIDYVGVDYAEAVTDGEVTNPGEYAEMQDFSLGIGQIINTLEDSSDKQKLSVAGLQLVDLIENKADAAEVSRITGIMRRTVVDSYKVTVIPRHPPNLKLGATLYAQQCGSCHGASGDGLGPLSAGMDPPPVNFLDKARYSQRTMYGLYNTITQGVPGTTMPAFHEMEAEQRWSLAFYVGQLAVTDMPAEHVEALLADDSLKPLLDIQNFTVTTPSEAGLQYGPMGSGIMDYLRTNPLALFRKESPLQFSRHRLDDVQQAYAAGEHEAAYRIAVEAYLEGFELIEQGLNAVDSELRLDIETSMTGLRYKIRQNISSDELQSEIIAIKGKLDVASERLDGRSLTGGAAFASAFFILVREGLEALLVVAALVAFLVKTEHRNSIRYLHYGWIGALAAGFVTWWVSRSLIEISGASREVTEGVAALVAASVLFYVGFWLHDKTTAAQWKAFIEKSLHKALSTGTLWGLAGLSFIAVYREVFETILFYEALWAQTDTAGRSMAMSGIATGAVVLAILAWVVFKYSMRLPLRQFFRVSGLLMFVLALIFAGKGVAALQEAGYIMVTPLNTPRIDLLGIYPNMQGLLLQLGLVLLALFLWYGLPGKRKKS